MPYGKRTTAFVPLPLVAPTGVWQPKYVASCIVTRFATKFQPLQLGFGSRGGCEAAVHALSSFLNSNKGVVILKDRIDE